jgi:two-component system response regulator MtrA
MLPRVLLVEDDERLGRQVVDSLRNAGLDPVWTTRGDDALAQDFGVYALVILDLMLPGAHGFDVLKALRTSHHPVPVIVLSARQDTADKIRGFELGADDYLTKPFWPEELTARVRARLRRPALTAGSHIVEIGDVRIDLDGRTVSVESAAIDVTRAEFNILAALARRPGAAVSRTALVESALDQESEADHRTLDVHVSRIRRKLGTQSGILATVWGVGYRLKADR